MDSPEEILKKVIQLQKTKRYSDQQMAQKIGCSRPLYQRTRTGKIPIGGSFLKGAMTLREMKAPYLTGQEDHSLEAIINRLGGRNAEVTRRTRETNISLELGLNGTGRWEINTGIPIFDHLLSALAKHGIFDIKLKAAGDDVHHLVEDVAICLGRAFNEALGEKRGIVRMADVRVPMDEALAAVALDIGGRGHAVLDLAFRGNDMAGLPGDLIRHFLESFAIEARLNLHVGVKGSSDHHMAEAVFKALGRALDGATRIDERIAEELPSTKGMLEK
jgi:imidazoleglycerol-phosphate dehydratase